MYGSVKGFQIGGPHQKPVVWSGDIAGCVNRRGGSEGPFVSRIPASVPVGGPSMQCRLHLAGGALRRLGFRSLGCKHLGELV